MKRFLRKNILRLRGFIKRSDFLFSLRRRFVDHDLQREKRRMKGSTLKSAAKVKSEMEAYRSYWKCRPDDYIRYGLFDRELSPEQILDYVPMHYYYCDFYSRLYSDTYRNDKDAENKLAQYRKFRERNVKVPEVVAVIKNGTALTDTDGTRRLPFGFLLERLKEGEKYFIKPTDGRCGFGIEVLTRRAGTLLHNGRAVSSAADIGLDKATDYLVQRQLIQRADLSEVNASTLNTLRTIVTYFNGEPAVIGVILRIGRAGSYVDNSGQGGISVAVDLETGRFAPYAGREHGGGRFDRHPDTGYLFSEGGISHWPRVKKEILEIAGKFAEYPMLGWDFAIADDGVYAIEYNLGFGIEHAQTILGGLRRRLGIGRPFSAVSIFFSISVGMMFNLP